MGGNFNQMNQGYSTNQQMGFSNPPGNQGQQEQTPFDMFS
jgi:hypothetical protein